MSETNLSTTPEQRALEVRATDMHEAAAILLSRGVVHIPALLSPEGCEAQVESFEQQSWYEHKLQAKSIEGGKRTELDLNGDVVGGATNWYALKKSVGDFVTDALGPLAAATPELTEWHLRLGRQAKVAPEIEVFKYVDGSTLGKHEDADNGAWPTQALATLRGSTVFEVYSSMDSEEPQYAITVEAGDIVILGGNDLGNGAVQLPHAARSNAGSRVLAIVQPKQRYDERVAASEAKRHMAEQRARRNRQSVGKRVLAKIVGRTP